jgi:hypothetical protein
MKGDTSVTEYLERGPKILPKIMHKALILLPAAGIVDASGAIVDYVQTPDYPDSYLWLV